MSANERQVGGDHYRVRKIQHWDLVTAYRYSYLGGQVSKYVSRHTMKGGIQDLQKADHFLQKMMEIHRNPPLIVPDINEYLDGMGLKESVLLLALHLYETGTPEITLLEAARKNLAAVINSLARP